MLNTSQPYNIHHYPSKFSIDGQIFDVIEGAFFPGEVGVAEGKISYIRQSSTVNQQLITPGLIDAHVHVESSLLPPSEFARLAVASGTVATVSDPHEIGNVLGVEGVEYMLQDAQNTPFKFNFGAPSCVPATCFESAGASIDVEAVKKLLNNSEIGYLGEMMDYPGVVSKNPAIMDKIKMAKRLGKPVDGHSPGLRGDSAMSYIRAGISTDHECVTREEAREKLELGMKIIIREGSAAKKF